MTTKKLYEKPSLEVVMLQQGDLIATSDFMPGVSLDLELDSEEYGIAD